MSKMSKSKAPQPALALLCALLVFPGIPLHAQPESNNQTARQRRLIGTITAINLEARTLTIKTDEGKTATAAYSFLTRCLIVPPGETDLGKATKCAIADAKVGDRVLARGTAAKDDYSVSARLIVVMSQTAIKQKQEADLQAWKTRGVLGRVTAIDEAKQEITIQSRTIQETKSIVIEAASASSIRRYPPGKFKFADTQPSSFQDIQIGDQLQVLGKKNEDGTRVKTEEIVAGSFRTFAATVEKINVSAGTVEVKDAESGKKITIRANEFSSLRRLPERMAFILARFIRGPEAGGQQGPGGRAGFRGGDGQRRGGQAGGARQGGERGGRGGGQGSPRGFSFQQMLSRSPEFTLAELKKGDALIISSTAGTNSDPWNAITIVAGVEPLLTAAEARGPLGGNLSFDININAGVVL